MFYPDDAHELAATVDQLLAAAATADSAGARPAAIIVPHAGYQYSAAVAAHAYAQLRGADRPERVVLLGPSHFVWLDGLAAPAADAWRSPLGDVTVDRAARDVAGLPADDRPHAREHAIEVQLPFLQRLFSGEVRVLPIAVGRCLPAPVADAIEAVLTVGDALVVVSTDLSHYHDESTARQRDARTAAAIRARDASAIRDEDACGAYALRGLLAWAERHDATVRQLDLRTSADAGGGHARVVGYGAFELTC
jgi:AmmeMemoRadiSam system protein B